MNSGNENLRSSVLFFIIVMDSGSLKRSCARALTIAWLHIIRPTHLCLVYGREEGSMTPHYYTNEYEFMEKVPYGSIAVIESSTTGKPPEV
jgi:hypothetical protein